MSENNTKMSISLPTFNGKDSEFAVFWPRFRAYATVKKFSKALKESTCGLPDDPNSTNLSEDTKKLIEVNNLAVASFTMSFTTAGLMEHIEASKTEMYEDGIAHVIVNEMMKKYRPRDRIAGVEAEKELMKLKMKSKSDPDKYFNKLSVLKNKYRSNANTFDEEKMIAATLAKAPGHYSAVLTQVLREKGESLKLEDMQSAMKEQWRIRNNLVNGSDAKDDSGSDSDGDDGTETALFMSNIKCYNCGETGHKANQCPKKKSNNRGGGGRRRFNGTCNNCGKRGHKAADCWEKESNKNKRPSNWKSSKSNDEVGGSAIELCTMATEYEMMMYDRCNGCNITNNHDMCMQYYGHEEVETDEVNDNWNEIESWEPTYHTDHDFCMMCCDNEEEEEDANEATPNFMIPSPMVITRLSDTQPNISEAFDQLEIGNEEGIETMQLERDESSVANETMTTVGSVERHYNEEGNLIVPERHEAGLQVLEHLGQEAYEAFMQVTNNTHESTRPNNEMHDENAEVDIDDDSTCSTEPPPLKRRYDSDSSDDEDSDEEESSDDEDSDDDDMIDEIEFGGMGANPTNLAQLKGNSEYWIGDTGCTTHLSINKIGMINTKVIKNGSTSVVMGEGSHVTPKLNGDLIGTICNKSGKELMSVKLSNVNYADNMQFNLFSLSSMMMKGWTLGGDDKCLTLSKDEMKIHFDIKIPTQNGCLFVLRIKRNKEKEAAMMQADEENKAKVAMDRLDEKINTVNINKVHAQFGHINEEMTRKMAKYFGIQLSRGSLKPCEACAIAKAKRKSLPSRATIESSQEVNGRVYLDISTVRKPKDLKGIKRVNLPNWRIIVDEYTGLKITDFYQRKNGMIEPTCEKFNLWKQNDKPVKIVRCDNAGENKKLEARSTSNDWKLGIKFEYTARDTPQQNHKAEKGFDTLYNRGNAMMNAANIPRLERFRIFREVFKCATHLDNLTIITLDGKTATRYEHWCGENPPFAKHLRTWGEAGVVKLKSVSTGKLGSRGTVCAFVGYSTVNAGDCYRMWNPVKKSIHITRDVRWLERMYYTHWNDKDVPKDKDMVQPAIEDRKGDGNGSSNLGAIDEASNESDDDEASNTSSDSDSSDDSSDDDNNNNEFNNHNDDDAESKADDDEGWQTTPKRHTTRSGRIVKTPDRLIDRMGTAMGESFSNAESNYYGVLADKDDFDDNEAATMAVTEICKEIAAVGAGIGGGFTNTQELHVMKYNEAMSKDDKPEWEKAVDDEHNRYLKHEVFKPVKIKDVPKDAKVITTTWAMKKKSNGTYRARMNMRGYEQKPGEHYDASSISSPVTNDVTIRIMLVLMLMTGWYARMVDVKGAFLHGEFDNNEVIYFKVPQGFEKHYDPNTYYLLLLKTAYGLKQAAMMFWRELLKAMKFMNCKRSVADPCLYYKWTSTGLLVWLSWIDDCLCMGKNTEVMKAKEDLKGLYDCDDVGEFNEYVGCKIERNLEERSLKMTQPVLLQSFSDEFDLPNNVFDTPAEPGKVLAKVEEGQEVSSTLQSKFRSGVGKLLHMMCWSRPEIWNAVRELSRRMSKSNDDHVKAMLRTMKYCVDHSERGWVLKPLRSWDGQDKNYQFQVKGKSDSNYATCSETRKSITGFIVLLEGAVIAVKSGMQKIVALSVTEAELIALVQCVQEMIYVMKILESLELKVQKPMIVDCDNKGAVDLANGWSIGGGTKHIDVRIMFLRQLKEQGTILVNWCPTDLNESDIFTKNTPAKIFNKHIKSMCGNT